MNTYGATPTESQCPVCSARSGIVLYTVDSEQAAQHYVLRESDVERHQKLKMHIEHLWQKLTCSVVQCLGCGFCFADPYVAGDARFYDLAYERTGYPAWKWEFQKTLDTIDRLQSEGQLGAFTLMEIGAGDGAFVKRVTPACTPKANVLCTEYSAYGMKEIHNYGIECINKDVRSLSE